MRKIWLLLHRIKNAKCDAVGIPRFLRSNELSAVNDPQLLHQSSLCLAVFPVCAKS